MNPKEGKSPAELPQSKDSWYFAIRKLRTWIVPEDQEPYRPDLLVIVDLHTGMFLGSQLGNQPTQQDAKEALISTMLKPEAGLKTIPQRPAQIHFEDRTLMEALTPAMQEIGIQLKYKPQSNIPNEFVGALEEHMREGSPEIPGLLSQRKVSPKMVGDFFTAAADFCRSAPWVQLANEDILAIQVPPQKEPYYVSILGQGGVEYGLALYKQWRDVERLFQAHDSFLEVIPDDGAHSLLFNEIIEVPFDDLEAIERYGWEVVDPQSYPVPIIFMPAEMVKRPDRVDILWYQAALRAIPTFVHNNLLSDQNNNLLPTEAEIPVQITTGTLTVKIKYPAGDLPDKGGLTPVFDLDDFEDELEIPFDRRAVEGDLARISSGFSSHKLDPKLEEAQDLIYQAWDEPNPAKRIIMAHKALKISPDCADAYVLLAEEEADSTQRVMEYFQQGVDAGQRALGEEFFVENVGYFWGLLETRPYMRALHGLADCLWKIGQKEKALDHYQEMLRLNPGDNQGIRYMLANLLLHMNRIQELDKLIDQYEDEDTAVWLYTQALLAFRQDGATAETEESMLTALLQNPYIPDYLTGKIRIPNRLPDYIGWGDENEAVSYAADHLNHWRRTPGAIEWLQNVLSSHPDTTTKAMTLPKPETILADKIDIGVEIGDSVKVNQGVQDPDFDHDLSGYQGRVESIYDDDEEPVICIQWDSLTLRNLPDQNIETCEENGLDWTRMNLSIDEVSLTEPRDTPADLEKAVADLSQRFLWAYLGKQGKRIKAVLGDLDEDDELAVFDVWREHLQEHLSFPFQANIAEFQEHGPLRTGARVKVTGIEGTEDLYGVLVKVTYERKRYVFPLCDLEGLEENSSNSQPVEDYKTWFANR